MKPELIDDMIGSVVDRRVGGTEIGFELEAARDCEGVDLRCDDGDGTSESDDDSDEESDEEDKSVRITGFDFFFALVDGDCMVGVKDIRPGGTPPLPFTLGLIGVKTGGRREVVGTGGLDEEDDDGTLDVDA